MHNKILSFILLAFTGFIFSCDNNELLPPATDPNPDNPSAGKYAGTYDGVYFETNNGVDENGVYKDDTSYAYSIRIDYAFGNSILIHGSEDAGSIEVDSTGYFSFVDYNRSIEGNFNGDSLYLHSKALNGTYEFPQWFVIQTLDFAGVKH